MSFKFLLTLNAIILPPFGFLLNLLLIWLILAKTPKEMMVHSRILLQTCIFDIIFLLQQSIGTVLTFRSDNTYFAIIDGYFALKLKKVFGISGLYILYVFHLWLYATDIMSVTIQFFYRYLLLNRNVNLSLFRYLQIFTALISVNVVVTFIFYFHHASSVYDGIRLEDRQLLPQIIDLSGIEETCFTIVDKKADSFDRIYFLLANFAWFFSFATIIFLGWRITVFVGTHAGFSENTRRLNKQLTLTLFLLAAYPLSMMILLTIFNMSYVIFYFFEGDASRNIKFLRISVAAYLPVHFIPMLNPMITILTNSPYRQSVIRIIFSSCYKAQQQIVPNN